ncbi:hypothetical protein P0Y35_17125 [Kiritimatiellaeota bacterium B1221]|nr:hypothetical protein [Kiritimatiellaeota bacterium B1221]
MNEKDPSQVQSKVFYLCLGGAFLLLALLNLFIFSPAAVAAGESKALLKDLDEKLSQGEGLRSRSDALIAQNKSTATDILAVMREDLPPDSGRYSWALSTLAEIALEADLDFSVSNHPHLRYIPVKTRKKLDVNSVPMWVSYAVDVELRVSFSELVKFLGRLHEAQPYCSIAALEMNALRSSPEKHHILITLEWPVLRFEEDFEHLQSMSVR